MNFYAVSALVVLLSCAFCGFFVYWKNPRGRKNLVFQLVLISTGLWSLFYIFWQLSPNPEEALLSIRLSILFGSLIPATNFHVIVTILDAETSRNRFYVKLFYATTLLLLLFVPTPYFISHVEPRGGFPFWPVPGPVMHVMFLFEFVPSSWILYLIWMKKSESTPLMWNKLKWVMVALLVGWAGGMSNDFLWYNIPIKPVISGLTSLGAVGMAITFFRPAIIDFDYLMRRFLLVLGKYFLICLLVFLALCPFLGRLPSTILVILAGLLGAVVYPFIKSIFERSTSLQKSNREIIKESTYTYKDLAQNIVDLTLSTVPVEMASVYFFDTLKLDYYLCGQKGLKSELARNLRFNRSALAVLPSDPLMERLQLTQMTVNLDKLINEMNEERDRPAIETMRRLEAEVCEPLIFGGKLRGFLAVGKKRNNTLFNDEELEMLRSYAQMGTEVMRTIMAMETELSQTSLYSHDINHDIRSITQTLEFLKSPMARSQPEEKVLNLVTQAERVAGHLYEWFQDNRDRSAMIMKTIRGEYAKEPVKLSEIVKTSTGKFALQAEKAGVAYKVDIEPYVEPFQGNETDLTRVVDNLISNALRHLPEQGGQLSITSRRKDSNYEIVVKDNGEGIDPKDLEEIWKMGWQGKDSKKGSAGFGLSIVKQIVQTHGGTIQAFSQGKGSGTEFRILLPIGVAEKRV